MAAYEDTQGYRFMLVIVRSSKETYTDGTYPPVCEGVFDSPFKGQTALECYHDLYQIRQEATSGLHHYYFVAMDEECIVDDTVMLCGWDGAEDYVHTMRVDFKLGCTKVCALSTGHQEFEDTVE